MIENLVRKLFIGVVSSLCLTSCGLSFQSDVDHYSTALQEESRCETSTVYSGGVTIIGSASFEKRTIDVVTETATSSPYATTLKNMVLSDPLPTALPIKNAEIAVYNSNNDRVQCGKTDSSGAIKATDGVTTLKIPNTPGSYHLRVVSRSYLEYGSPTDFVYISVKQDKYRNELHALMAPFTLNGSGSSIPIVLVAKARQTDSPSVEGGAFNILNTLQTGFDYIKTNTPGVNTQCLSQKVNVFWKAGFNPMQYQFPESDPATLGNTSYYSSVSKELFISGGQVGDMSLSNTDHFDDFAIVHESGHFIEDHCGQWASPGGNHTLTSRIDPRLAWSEGFANFFAAHVVHDRLNDLDSTLTAKLSNLTENISVNKGWTYFFNSYGFSDSVQNIGNGDGFVIDFKRSGGDPGSYQFAPYTGQDFDKVVPGTYPGEGHTREGAISRGLFKLTNACGTYCAATPILFLDIWKSLDRITGTASNQNPFHGVDKVLEKLKTAIGGAWTTGSPSDNQVIESEALHLVSNGTFGTSPLSWPGYGTKLVTGSSCGLKILPKPDSALNNSSSDQRYSNHFYTIDLGTLSGLSQISVTFTKNAGNSMDHDLILFKPGYFFNDDYTCTSYSASGSCSTFAPNRNSTNSDVFVMNREPATTLSSTYTKTIFLDGIDTTQKYLLDIRTWTAGTSPGTITDYSYVINSNLGVLCPQ